MLPVLAHPELQVRMEEDMALQIVEWQRRDFEAGYAPGGMPVVIHRIEPGACDVTVCM